MKHFARRLAVTLALLIALVVAACTPAQGGGTPAGATPAGASPGAPSQSLDRGNY
jgi:predicted small secreted protein